MQAQSADGVLHEFPDGTDPAVIDRVMKSYAVAHAAPAASAPPQAAGGTLSDDIYSMLSQNGQDESNQAAMAIGRPDLAAPVTAPAPLQAAPQAPANTPYILPGFRGFNQTVGGMVAPVLDAISASGQREAQAELASGQMGKEGLALAPDTNRYLKPSAAYDQAFVGPAHTDPAGKILDKAGGYIAAGLPVSAAAGAAANSGFRFLNDNSPGLMNAGRGAANDILNYFGAKPGAALAADVAGNAVAGTGAEVGKETGNNETMGALLASGLVGAVPAAMNYTVTGNAVKRGAQWGANLLSKALPAAAENPTTLLQKFYAPIGRAAAAAREADGVDKVGQHLALIFKNNPVVDQNVANANQLRSTIPGFDPTLAQQTGYNGLLNLQKDMEANAGVEDLRAMTDRRNQNAQAISSFADNAAPAPTSTPYPEDLVAKAAQTRVAAANSKIDSQIENTQGQIQDIGKSLPEAAPDQAGQQLRDLRATQYDEGAIHTDALRAAIDPGNSVNVPTDTLNTDLKSAAKSLNTDLTSPTMPPLVRELIQKTEPTVEPGGPWVPDEPPPAPKTTPQTTDINSLLTKRTQFLQELRRLNSANLTPDQVGQRDVLNAALTKVNGFINNLEVPDKGVQARFNAYRSYYRDEFVPKFEEGASRAVGQYDRFGYGKNRVPDEAVAGKFFGGPNNISGAQQFTKLYGNDPAARQIATDYYLDQLRQKAVDPVTGAIRPGSVQDFLTKNSRMLDQVPWVRDAIQTNNPDELYARLAGLNARKQTVADSVAAQTIGQEPGKMIDSAIKDWRVARTLKKSVAGNPEAEQALTRAVWTRAIGSGQIQGDNLYNGAKISKFIDDNRRALSEILTPEHLDNLQAIADASQMIGRTPAPLGSPDLPKIGLEKALDHVGLSPMALSSQAMGVAGGRISEKVIGINTAARGLFRYAERDQRRMWQRALYDPKLAEAWANVARNGKPTPMQMQKLRSFLLTTPAIEFADRNQQQGQPPQ